MKTNIFSNQSSTYLLILVIFCFVVITYAVGYFNPKIDSSQPSEIASIPTKDDRKKDNNQQILPPVQFVIQHPTQTIPDFASIADIQQKKRLFFDTLTPGVIQVNQHITTLRKTLTQLQKRYTSKGSLTQEQQLWLQELTTFYGVKAENTNHLFQELLLRVNIIPHDLVLVQAANESGWGGSRFTQKALNFFGQWCWTKGCGIVPKQRSPHEQHEVRRFSSVEESIFSYIHNLNTHFAYRELRQLRAKQAQDSIRADKLVEGLLKYSTRGQAYIDELKQMLRVNHKIIEASLEHSEEYSYAD